MRGGLRLHDVLARPAVNSVKTRSLIQSRNQAAVSFVVEFGLNRTRGWRRSIDAVSATAFCVGAPLTNSAFYTCMSRHKNLSHAHTARTQSLALQTDQSEAGSAKEQTSRSKRRRSGLVRKHRTTGNGPILPGSASADAFAFQFHAALAKSEAIVRAVLIGKKLEPRTEFGLEKLSFGSGV